MKLDNIHSIAIVELRERQLFEAHIMSSIDHDPLFISDIFPSEDQAAAEAVIYFITNIKGKQNI